jgi:hypothetical protein
VENIFDFSFLLRDGTARIEVDPKTHCTGVGTKYVYSVLDVSLKGIRIFYALCCLPAQAQPVLPDQDGAPAGRKQCIFKLDFNSYKVRKLAFNAHFGNRKNLNRSMLCSESL